LQNRVLSSEIVGNATASDISHPAKLLDFLISNTPHDESNFFAGFD
jgi:hypothetical protein